MSNELRFQRFGRQWVVTGPVGAIEQALTEGSAVVRRANGERRTVVPASRFVTRKGATSWTFQDVETAAFVPVDDRPESERGGKRKRQGKGQGKAQGNGQGNGQPAPAPAPAPQPAGLALFTPDQLAALSPDQLAALVSSVQQTPEQASQQPEQTPQQAPATDDQDGPNACEACGKSGVKLASHRGALKAPHLEDVKVCYRCKSADPATVIARRDRREAAALVTS